MNRTKDILEIDKVLKLINQFIRTEKGNKFLFSNKIYLDFNELKKEYALIDELKNIYDNKGDLPIYSKLDIEVEINNLKKGKYLNNDKIILLKDEIKSSIDLLKFYNSLSDEYILIDKLFLSIKPNIDLYKKINQTFSNSGEILDSASYELSSLRKQIFNLDKKIHNEIINLYNKNKDIIKGDNFVIKNGHFVLPINSSLKRSILGVVQDISDSGQTTFIEPFEIAELENEKSILLIKEKEEITKILQEFNKDIIKDSNQLIINNNVIGKLDLLISKIKYLIKYNCHIPLLSYSRKIKLINARHPLLDNSKCVPNNFILDKDHPIMLISGPNAGGKTIALKTIGTLCYLFKLGVPLNCDENSELSIFNNIYVDIGDYQSIEYNLSTFSSHVVNISNILKKATFNDLIIFDELCNGTDPKEGDALSVAILKNLIDKNIFSIISSHYPLIKKYGLENDKVINASFIFDEKNIKPTYKLAFGISGKSYGFLIANRYGIDKNIINDAKEMFENNYQNNFDKQSQILEEKELNLLKKEQNLKALESKISKMQSENDKQKNENIKALEKIKQKKNDDFDIFLNDKYREIDRIYQEFLKDKKEKKAYDELSKITLEESKIEDIQINDIVLIKSIDSKGIVSSIKKDKVKVIDESGFTINTTLSNLKKINSPLKQFNPQINIDEKILNLKVIPTSLNLIGYHTYEGIEAMKDFLSNAYSSKISEVRIIHGFGSGKLREALHNELKNSKYIDSFHLSDPSNGGNGVTIVKIKND